MRSRARVAALVICAMTMRGAFAQTLELTRPIAAPTLPNPSLVASTVKTLEQEATDLSAAGANAEDEALGIALRARANIRRLAAELLALGDRSGRGDGHVIVLKGLKLAVACEALDQAIARAVEPRTEATDGDADRSAVVAALTSFNLACADHVQEGAAAQAGKSTIATVDQWTAALLSRLLPLVAKSSETVPSHWVADRRGDGGPEAATRPEDDDAAIIQHLRERIIAAPIDEPTRSNLRSILEFLDRGRHFAELRPRVRQYTQTVSDVLDCADAIENAQWLGDENRSPIRAALAQAVEWFRALETRAHGFDATTRLGAMTKALAPATKLANERVEPKPLRSAFLAAQVAAEKAPTSAEAVRHFSQLAAIFERMVAYRELTASGLARELRQAERDLAKTYRDSEEKVLKEVAAGALIERSMSDPALLSLLDDHRQRLDDLQRLRRMPAWSAAIAQIHPPASKDFDAQTKRWASALLDPSRRPEAILTITRFEQELQLFGQLPFESALKDSRPEAIELTAGQHEQVLAIIIEKRRAWADEWSRLQQTPQPAQTMALLHRLTQTLRDAAALTQLNPAMLNRWPAWHMSEAVVDRGRRDVITRLKLACAALIQDDEGLVAQQLERVQNEAPLARLAGRLAHMLGNDLAERDDGAAGVLVQLVHEPPADAALLERRDDLADLCRYAAEAEHALASGQAEAAEEINAYVRERVEGLLHAIE